MLPLLFSWLCLLLHRDAFVSFLVGLVQEFEDAMYCPNKRKEYLAAAIAAAAAVLTTAVVSSAAVAENNNSVSDVVSASSSSSVALKAHVIEFFEVSPTYEALLRGELQQQRVLDDMLAKVRT